MGIVLLMAVPMGVLATSSGLNNIPTADTPPDKTAVIQTFSTFGSGRGPDHSAGLKMGFDLWEGHAFEWGIDGRFAPDPIGPAVFQLKYALQPWEKLPRLGIGAVNIATTRGDRARVGEPYKFAVLTHDFGLLRAHAGYGFADHNNAGFLGIDKTFPLFHRDLTLRADAIQIRDESDWLTSLGFLYSLHRNVALESWVSQPVDTGKASFVIKLNFVIPFGRDH